MNFLLIDFGASRIKSILYNKEKDLFSKEDVRKSPLYNTDKLNKSVVKDVVSALKKATKAHSGQAKDLEKAMKTEADQHGDEINQKKLDKVKADKKLTDSGSKVTKVETEPKVDYKN